MKVTDRTRYERWRREGRCWRCGAAAAEGRSLCAAHLAAAAAREAARRAAMTDAERQAVRDYQRYYARRRRERQQAE